MVIKQKLRVMQAQLQRVTRLDSGTDPLVRSRAVLF